MAEHAGATRACAGAGRPRSPSSGSACASAPSRTWAEDAARRGCGPSGCPGRRRPRPGRARSGRRASRAATSSSASSQPISSQPSRVRRSGRRRRSGSSWTSLSATALGQMWPRLKGSSSSPRMSTMRLAASASMAMPHIASHRLQVRKWVRGCASRPHGMATMAFGTFVPFSLLDDARAGPRFTGRSPTGTAAADGRRPMKRWAWLRLLALLSLPAWAQEEEGHEEGREEGRRPRRHARDLLKEAEAKTAAGDVDGAVEILRKARPWRAPSPARRRFASGGSRAAATTSTSPSMPTRRRRASSWVRPRARPSAAWRCLQDLAGHGRRHRFRGGGGGRRSLGSVADHRPVPAARPPGKGRRGRGARPEGRGGRRRSGRARPSASPQETSGDLGAAEAAYREALATTPRRIGHHRPRPRPAQHRPRRPRRSRCSPKVIADAGRGRCLQGIGPRRSWP